MQLPRYKCHKEVSAAKITEILTLGPPAYARPVCRGSYVLGSACGHCERCEYERRHGIGEDTIGARLTFEPEMSNQFGDAVMNLLVTRAWMAKHNPQVGGYLVRYDDGYESFSPAAAFEGGYTRIPD